MAKEKEESTKAKRYILDSVPLNREVKIDFYLPDIESPVEQPPHLLLINDGQDLVTMGFDQILEKLNVETKLEPLLCVGIHCSAERKLEYGTTKVKDYKDRGSKADLYEEFVFNELIPFIRKESGFSFFKDISYTGFSLGGLSALDLVWSHPEWFVNAGVFSGSLWWRRKAQEDPDFDESNDRIMHQKIRTGKYYPHLRFFFETGTKDETADRNHNGIIDSIDDTLSLIAELEVLGYNSSQVTYLEIKDGKHDVPTWARAFPHFLKWAFGKK